MLPYEDRAVEQEVWPHVRESYNRAERLHDFVVAEFFNPSMIVTRLPLNEFVLMTVMGLLTKACKTHRAVEILASKGLGEDAATVARSLYETALIVLFILKDDSKTRASMYMTYSIGQKRKLLNSWQSSPSLRGLSPEGIAGAKEQTDELLALWQPRCNGADALKHWSGRGSLEEAAKFIGEEGSYQSMYRVMSPHAHAADLFSHMEPQEEGPAMANLLPSPTFTTHALLMSSQFLWSIASHMDEAWGLGFTSRLEQVKPKEPEATEML